MLRTATRQLLLIKCMLQLLGLGVVLVQQMKVAAEVKNDVQPTWTQLQDQLYTEHALWSRLSGAHLLKQFITTPENAMSQPTEGKKQDKEIPIMIESRRLELERWEDTMDRITTSSPQDFAYPLPGWDSQHSVMGIHSNIFTFWDDPICETFVFPNGLFVCGNARVRGTLTVLSGMNLTGLLDSRYSGTEATAGTGSSKQHASLHLRQRCTIDPSKKLSTSGEAPKRDDSTFIQQQNGSPHQPRGHQQPPWCFINLVIRSADVFVLNQVEVTGSLYAQSVRVDAGATCFVGLRGLVYTHPRLTDIDFSQHAKQYAAVEAELPKRRKKTSELKTEQKELKSPPGGMAGHPATKTDEALMEGHSMRDSHTTHQRLTFQQYQNIEKEREMLFQSEWRDEERVKGDGDGRKIRNLTFQEKDISGNDDRRSGKEDIDVAPNATSKSWGHRDGDPTGPGRRKLQRWTRWTPDDPFNDDRFSIRVDELVTMECPVVDSHGSILFIERLWNGSYVVKTDWDRMDHKETTNHFTDTSGRYVNTWTNADNFREALAKRNPFSSGSTSFSSSSSSSSFSPLSSSWPSRDPGGSDTRVSPFGPVLPFLTGNSTIGDLVTLEQIIVGNSGLLWVYGNVIGDGVIVESSSQLHSHCGHLFMNVTNNLGLTVLGSSSVSIGGYLESIVPRMVLQHGSDNWMQGSMVSIKYVQLLKSSEGRILGELLTGIMSISEGSSFHGDGNLEVEMLVDVSDGSNLIVEGNVGLGLLQIEDGSVVRIVTKQPNRSSHRDSTAPSVPSNSHGQTESHVKDSHHDDSSFVGSSSSLSHSADGDSHESQEDASSIRNVVVIEDSLILDGNSVLEIPESSLLIHNALYIGNQSSLVLPMGDVFLMDIGTVKIASSTVFIGGTLLCPQSSVLIGLGSHVTIRGSLRASGITALQRLLAKKKTQKMEEHGRMTEESEQKKVWASHSSTGPLTDLVVNSSNSSSNSSNSNSSNSSSNSSNSNSSNSSSNSSNSSSNSSNSNSSNSSSNSSNSNSSNSSSNTSSNSSSNTSSSSIDKKKNFEDDGKPQQMDDDLGTSSLSGPRPALFVESSVLIVDGLLECLNSWVELTRRSVVVVGKGVMSHTLNSTLIRVRLRSTLTVIDGQLVSGVSLFISEQSMVKVLNGTIQSHGVIELKDRGQLKAESLFSKSDLSIMNRSIVKIDKQIEMLGALLSIGQHSTLKCQGLRQKRGDVFVEDFSLLHVSSGDLWVYGSVVAQDRSTIHVVKGHLIAIQGDVIAENFSQLQVGQTILLHSFYRNHPHHSARPIQTVDTENKTGGNVDSMSHALHRTHHSTWTGAGTETPSVSKLKAVDAPFEVGLSPQLLNDFYPLGRIRRTVESSIQASRLLPTAIHVEIYVQDIPAVFTDTQMRAARRRDSSDDEEARGNNGNSPSLSSSFNTGTTIQGHPSGQQRSPPDASATSASASKRDNQDFPSPQPQRLIQTRPEDSHHDQFPPHLSSTSFPQGSHLQPESTRASNPELEQLPSHGVTKMQVQDSLNYRNVKINDLNRPDHWDTLVVKRQRAN